MTMWDSTTIKSKVRSHLAKKFFLYVMASGGLYSLIYCNAKCWPQYSIQQSECLIFAKETKLIVTLCYCPIASKQSDRHIKHKCFFISNTQELLNEHKRLTSHNLSGTYQGESLTRPPSCTTPRQPTIYNWGYNHAILSTPY